MKKILILLFIGLNLFGNDQLPKWIEKDPDNSAKYFKGASTWYGVDDHRMKDLANKDALQSAYTRLGSFFGMKLDSVTEREKKSDSFGTSTKTKKVTKTKSNQLLFDMKPFKIHKELSEDGKHFRIYVLLRLDSITESDIKAENKIDKEEFKELKQKALRAMGNKDFFNARNFIELAKGKRSAYMDDTIETLSKRLKELEDGLLVANIYLNKEKYIPKEQIEVEVSLNQDGNLYLFHDTGDDIEMLFPNKFQKKAKLKKNDMLIFPNEDVYLEAYEESMGKDTKIIAIASKNILSIKKDAVDKIDGIHIFEKDGNLKNKLERCIDQGECTKNIVNFKVSNNSDTKVTLEYRCSHDIKRKIKNILKSKGIKSQKSDSKIVFEVKRESRYSSMMNAQINSYVIKAKLYKKNKLKKTRNTESDIGMLEDEIINLYLELKENI